VKVKQYLIVIFLFAALSSGGCSNAKPDEEVESGNSSNTVSDSVYQIITERINGPANIRMHVNGPVAFSLNDSTAVTCTELENGWFHIGVVIELMDSEYGLDTLKAGKDIIIDGRIRGKILADIPVTTQRTNSGTWAELTGFTHKDNIYPWSVIEHALSEYLAIHPDRSLDSLMPFIKSFGLEADTLYHYNSYFNYENWIDDPSALYRLNLLFDSEKLVGIIHSRPLDFPGSTDYKLERGFRARFYNDADKQKRESFFSYFNQMINSVD
jgi:hypothetical protein